MGAKETITAITDWGLGLYNSFLEKALGMSFLGTYDSQPDKVIRSMCKKHFGMTDAEADKAANSSILQVAGREATDRVATKLIRTRAFRSALVTALCVLPDNWMTWGLLVVDIVFFQLQIFCITHDIYLLYLPKEKRQSISFNYATLAQAVVRIQATGTRQQITHWAKKAGGVIGKFIIHGKGRVVSVIARQLLKWTGIVLTQKNLELAMTIVMALGCALIDGLVSYWLFIPMARRLQRKTVKSLQDD